MSAPRVRAFRFKRVHALIVMAIASWALCWFSYRIVTSILMKERTPTNKPLVMFSPPKSSQTEAWTFTDPDTSPVTCFRPYLDHHSDEAMKFFKSQPLIDCSSAMMDWVYVTDGVFHISHEATRKYGNITCEYRPVIRHDDYSVDYGEQVKPMLDGMLLQSDFFHVVCVSASGEKYVNVHAAGAKNNSMMERLRKFHSSAKSTRDTLKQNDAALLSKRRPAGDDESFTQKSHSLKNMNVFVLGFDSMSRMAWNRHLPQTLKYFVDFLGAIDLENYHVVGDATAAALLPMLTGRKKEELPEARPAMPWGIPVDNYPWVWKEFSKHGYVTAFAEDSPQIGTFQYNMRGFQFQPTDQYMRLFYLAELKARLKNPPLCLGDKPRHMVFLNYLTSLLDMYKEFPKFFFAFYVEMSHDDNNPILAMDDDLVSFQKELNSRGHLNSTVMVLLADHGARFSPIRATTQGSLEERLPYVSFLFPPWFHKLHPTIIKNVRTNAKRLTTPLDIHATFLDILGHPNTKQEPRAISLLKEVPKERTCADAGISPHYCTCLSWQTVNTSHPLVGLAVTAAIKTINSFTQSRRDMCAELTLLKITKSLRLKPTAENGFAVWRKPAFQNRGSWHPPRPDVFYQVSFKTLPGHQHYEVTCQYDVTSGTFSVSEGQISRMNRYGSQSACLQRSLQHLRNYCFCVK